MKKQTRISALAAAVLFTAAMQETAVYCFAADSTETTESTTSESCGESASWSFDETSGVLTISGSGAMEDYTSSSMPWYDYTDAITAVIIEKDITTIGDYAFESCESLHEIQLQSRITFISEGAFMSSGLRSVKLPDSI